MKIEIKNYRGVSDAALTMAPIALVAGMNGAGKSSVAQAVAAALTKNPAPIAGIAKNAAGKLLRDGAKRGKCTVGDDAGSVTANWPGASTSEDGQPPFASEIACGLVSLVDMKPKDAAAILITAIEALPTLEHLQQALPGVGEEILKQVWAAIQADGWDSAHKRAQERGAKLKGAWEHVAGEKYGSAKADGWCHPRLQDDERDDLSEKTLTDDVNARQARIEAAIANQAADAALVAQLQQRAAGLDEAKRQHSQAVDQLTAHRDAQTEIETQLAALPHPEVAETLAECPHCKGHLVVVSRTVVKAPTSGISAEENQARADAVQQKGAELAQAQGLVGDTQRLCAQLEHAIKDAENAARQLTEIQAGEFTSEQIQQLRDELAEAEADLVAFRAEISAGNYHQQIHQNQKVIDALAPDGVRQQVLSEKMSKFNAALERLSAAAGWPVVKIDAELSVTLGDRPYILLSESEKYRARTALQVALADLDGSDAVIVDAADILDRAGRNGLFKMLKASGLRALVCMTMNVPTDVPDLAKAGLGASYWLGDSILAPLSAQ
jgi:hypothetical protein